MFFVFSNAASEVHWDGNTCPRNITLSIGVRAKVHTESEEAGLIVCTQTFGSSFCYFEVLVEHLNEGMLMIGLAVDSQLVYWISSDGTTSTKVKVREILSGNKIGVGCSEDKIYFVQHGELIAQEEASFKHSQLIPAIVLSSVGTSIMANFNCAPPASVGIVHNLSYWMYSLHISVQASPL